MFCTLRCFERLKVLLVVMLGMKVVSLLRLKVDLELGFNASTLGKQVDCRAAQ